MNKTSPYQKKASVAYAERMQEKGYKRACITFWVKKNKETSWRKKLKELLGTLKKEEKK